jgi:hypothetical protein
MRRSTVRTHQTNARRRRRRRHSPQGICLVRAPRRAVHTRARARRQYCAQYSPRTHRYPTAFIAHHSHAIARAIVQSCMRTRYTRYHAHTKVQAHDITRTRKYKHTISRAHESTSTRHCDGSTRSHYSPPTHRSDPAARTAAYPFPTLLVAQNRTRARTRHCDVRAPARASSRICFARAFRLRRRRRRQVNNLRMRFNDTGPLLHPRIPPPVQFRRHTRPRPPPRRRRKIAAAAAAATV